MATLLEATTAMVGQGLFVDVAGFGAGGVVHQDAVFQIEVGDGLDEGFGRAVRGGVGELGAPIASDPIGSISIFRLLANPMMRKSSRRTCLRSSLWASTWSTMVPPTLPTPRQKMCRRLTSVSKKA